MKKSRKGVKKECKHDWFILEKKFFNNYYFVISWCIRCNKLVKKWV